MILAPALAAVGAGVAALLAVHAVRAAVRLASESTRLPVFDVRSRAGASPWARRREDRKADRALPDTLERVARALRSGASLPQALAAGQPDTPALLARHWRRLVSESADVGVLAAAERWRGRHPSRAVALTVAALAVASDVGGPQAKAIDTVAATLRQRVALEAEVGALSAQSRMSAVVIALAPVAFAVIASGLEPAYLAFLFGTPAGLVMLATGLALQLAGLWWMARLSRVEM